MEPTPGAAVGELLGATSPSAATHGEPKHAYEYCTFVGGANFGVGRAEGEWGGGETLPRHSMAQCASYMIPFLGKQIV